ncbi:hypothetical protein JOB18_045251 [Solea senegalensis]|uniref:Uncharacterized protein n=1 Tax=Solea senegalensis TaxID=28829 RepID=A0AAV6TBH4_SOLSE|nr:hypothetical protein JOB18_045251 [Solea senegalensis]
MQAVALLRLWRSGRVHGQMDTDCDEEIKRKKKTERNTEEYRADVDSGREMDRFSGRTQSRFILSRQFLRIFWTLNQTSCRSTRDWIHGGQSGRCRVRR